MTAHNHNNNSHKWNLKKKTTNRNRRFLSEEKDQIDQRKKHEKFLFVVFELNKDLVSDLNTRPKSAAFNRYFRVF